MRISFHSQSENEKIFFQTEANKVNNTLSFMDKSVENTNIKISIYSDHLSFVRTGDTEMDFELYLNQLTDGKYRNKMGLEFTFMVKCTSLEIRDKRLYFDYELYLDEEYSSRHKIWILFL